jgi:hypothetical protein
MNPRNATIGRITYERGKRITFSHSHLTNLKAVIHVVLGHGDQSLRAFCSIDFFSLSSAGDDRIPTIYDVDIGMDRPTGERFGILNLSFQLMPLREFQEAVGVSVYNTPRIVKFHAPSELAPVRASPAPTKKISVSRQDGARPPPASARVVHVNEPSQQQQHSGRSTLSSIHERYMKKNELWMGHHASTHADGDSRRTASRSAHSRSSLL